MVPLVYDSKVLVIVFWSWLGYSYRLLKLQRILVFSCLCSLTICSGGVSLCCLCFFLLPLQDCLLWNRDINLKVQYGPKLILVSKISTVSTNFFWRVKKRVLQSYSPFKFTWSLTQKHWGLLRRGNGYLEKKFSLLIILMPAIYSLAKKHIFFLSSLSAT